MSVNSTAIPFNWTVADLASGFPTDSTWYPIAFIWIPSIILGLPANILVIFLSKHAKLLGNFCFAINALSVINSLHLLARTIILIHYFYHLLLSIKTSLTECSIMGNILDQYVGYYIVFYIPLLALYRYILLCTKRGEAFLSKKRNVWLMILSAAIIPTAYVVGKIYGMIYEHRVQTDEMCPFKYDDNLCSVWCEPLYQYGIYASYGLSVLLSVLLFIYLYRSFQKVNIRGHRRRLRDEVFILAGIILHLIIPVALTIPSRGKALLLAIGIDIHVDKNVAQAVYNYNPLCDAILTIICVKPYRLGFLRLTHLGGSESTVANPTHHRTNRLAVHPVVVTRR